jgi:L-amino acid N-acyltransferase YncA
MLLQIKNYSEIDARKLMDIYEESNFENVDYFYPDEVDKTLGVKKVEEGFLDFLKSKFFTNVNSTYWVYEENGVWLSTARTCFLEPDIIYLEALETMPRERRKGYGYKLLSLMIEALKKEGIVRICDCVSKKNIPSLKTHEKCGFKIVSDSGRDYLNNDIDEHCYSLEYRF